MAANASSAIGAYEVTLTLIGGLLARVRGSDAVNARWTGLGRYWPSRTHPETCGQTGSPIPAVPRLSAALHPDRLARSGRVLLGTGRGSDRFHTARAAPSDRTISTRPRSGSCD